MIILNQSDGMKMIFNEVPIISFKKDKNIKDNYRFTESTTYSFMERKANVRNVGEHFSLCWYPIEATDYNDNDGNTINIQWNINCKTVGVINCINYCTMCEKNGCRTDWWHFVPTHVVEFFKNTNSQNGRSCSKSF